MPLERVSQGFKDISMTFQSNPLSSDLIALKNETAIARSIRNIVFTLPGEKFFNENFGSKVSRALFENVDEISASIIRDEIRNSINNYEPRVRLIEVQTNPDYDNGSFDVVINYRIIGADVPAQQLQFVLQPTR
jgi:phage baseplate assembly protein W